MNGLIECHWNVTVCVLKSGSMWRRKNSMFHSQSYFVLFEKFQILQ